MDPMGGGGGSFLSLVGNGSYGRGKPFYPRWVMEGEGEAFLSLVGNGSYGRGRGSLSILDRKWNLLYGSGGGGGGGGL